MAWSFEDAWNEATDIQGNVKEAHENAITNTTNAIEFTANTVSAAGDFISEKAIPLINEYAIYAVSLTPTGHRLRRAQDNGVKLSGGAKVLADHNREATELGEGIAKYTAEDPLRMGAQGLQSGISAVAELTGLAGDVAYAGIYDYTIRPLANHTISGWTDLINMGYSEGEKLTPYHIPSGEFMSWTKGMNDFAQITNHLSVDSKEAHRLFARPKTQISDENGKFIENPRFKYETAANSIVRGAVDVAAFPLVGVGIGAGVGAAMGATKLTVKSVQVAKTFGTLQARINHSIDTAKVVASKVNNFTNPLKDGAFGKAAEAIALPPAAYMGYKSDKENAEKHTSLMKSPTELIIAESISKADASNSRFDINFAAFKLKHEQELTLTKHFAITEPKSELSNKFDNRADGQNTVTTGIDVTKTDNENPIISVDHSVKGAEI